MLVRKAVGGIVAAALGLALVPAAASAATRTVCAAGCDFTTITSAVAASADGDTIEVGPGAYVESVAIGTPNLTVTGAGPTQTTVTSTAGSSPVFNLGAGADGLVLSNMTLQGVARTSALGAVNVGAPGVDDVTLEDLLIRNATYGIAVRPINSIAGWTIERVTATANGIGALFRGNTVDVGIADSHFDGNDVGIYSEAIAGGDVRTPGVFQDVVISNTTLNANSMKGAYLEAAQDVTFENVEANATGSIATIRYSGAPIAGIDVNVKYNAFSNVQIVDSEIVDTRGTALTLKGRNDGNYAPVPATLTGLVLDGLTITGSTATPHVEALGHGILIGNNVISPRIANSRIVNNVAGPIVSYVDPGTTVDASNNWWGCNAGPGGDGCGAITVQPGTAPVQTDPRIVLGVDASPFQVFPGDASTVTASIARNSAGAAVSGLPEQTIALASTVGNLSSSGGTTSGGTVSATVSGYVISNGSVSATLDGQTVSSPFGIVPRPEPTPEPPPAPPAPPADPTPTQSSEPSGNATPPAPTAQQARVARGEATDQLGVRARPERSLDLGPALVFVPTGGRDRPEDAPRFRGSTATIDRGAVSGGERQNLMAISCPTTSCVATAEIELTYTDRRGRRRTVTLPAQRLELGEGESGLVTLRLPRAVRQAMLRGRGVRMNVGLSLTDPAGTQLGEDGKAFKLKTPKAKRSRR